MQSLCCSHFFPKQSTGDMVTAATARIQESFAQPPNLILLFAGGLGEKELAEFVTGISDAIPGAVLLGCNAESLIASESEYEDAHGAAIWAASWPDSRLTPFHLEFERVEEGPVLVGWPDDWRQPPTDDDFLIVLGEPFSFPMEMLIDRLAEDHPDLQVVGGMASAGHVPGENRLIFNDLLLDSGALVLRVQGGVKLKTTVSQGCRPIGKPFVITEAERNEILQLGGKPALLVLSELFNELPTKEQRALQNALLMGRVIDEYKDQFAMGDFLIRNVMGVDKERMSITVGDFFRAGQTIQFHIRDEESADHEMEQLLQKVADKSEPLGGLLFTCNGRGTRLFSEPHHDAAAIQKHFEGLPVAGFFAAGEIGPVAGRAFMHGFTASLALFESTK